MDVDISDTTGAEERDLFGRRVCDDLCELILQWLPIQDVVRHTAVSHQFRRCLRTIGQKQRRLTVEADPRATAANTRTNWPDLLRRCDHSGCDGIVRAGLSGATVCDQLYTVDVTRLERVLRSLPDVREVCFGRQHITNDNEVLNTITRCCRRLSSIRFDISDCSLQTIERFGRKFGADLRTVEFTHSSDTFAVRPLIRMCPNLHAVHNVYFECLFDGKLALTKNITKLCVYGVEDMSLLDTFVAECPLLTHLDIRLYMKDSFSTNQVLRKLSQLRALRVLFVYCGHYDTPGQCLAKSIAMIAESCKLLTTFAFDFETSDAFNTKKCFEGFRGFHGLRQLRFDITHFSDDQTYPNDKLANECLANCRRLTHLELSSHQINDQFFVDDDGFADRFPELRHLLIRTKDELTDQSLRAIARCQHLRTLVVSCFGEPEFKTLKSITDDGMVSVIKQCQHLRQIHVWNRTNITATTVEALIAKSVANPKIFFRFSFLGICEKIDLKSLFKSGGSSSAANVVINDCPTIHRLLFF